VELGHGERHRRRALAAPAVILRRRASDLGLGAASAPGEAERRVGEEHHRRLADLSVHPDHAKLVDEVIEWFGGLAAYFERTVIPSAADEFALQRWATYGYETDPSSLGDTGSWTQLNERDLTDVEQPVLPTGFQFRTPTRAARRVRSRLTWMPGLPRRTRPRATTASGGRPGTAAICTSWSRPRTERWPPRRSCGWTKPTKPSSSSRLGRTLTTAV
jgi:hypothetical protein